MKKHYLLTILFSLVTSICLKGQIVITMEQDGGVYKIPCSVNGVKMKFIFDTGASVVSLSKSMATYMEDNGYLKKSDYLGKSKSIIADGSAVSVEVVNLKDFEIGGLHLKDVIATVKDGQNVPLLMGQSAIEKLGRVSIEKGRLIIHQTNANLSSTQIEDLRNDIQNCLYENKFETAINKLSLLRRATKLKDCDYYYYVWALSGTHDYEQVISVGKDWEESGVITGDYYKSDILNDMAFAYMMTGQPNEAILYYQESLPLQGGYLRGTTLVQIASCYADLNNKSQTELYIKKALSAQYTYINRSLSDVMAGEVNDPRLGAIYWEYALFEEKFNKDLSQRDYYLKLSAKCGWQTAIDYCFNNGINYTK